MKLDPYLSLVIKKKNRLTGDRRPYIRTKSSKMLKKSVNAYSRNWHWKELFDKDSTTPKNF